MNRFQQLWILLLFALPVAIGADPIPGQTPNHPAPGPPDPILIHPLDSPHQDRQVTLKVLLPQDRPPGRKFPLILVLPVEKQGDKQYGDGIGEIHKKNLHNRYPAIYVEPTFAQLPWYADHPTNPRIAQESHLIKVVLPFVDKTYPVEKDQRFLLGYSKSGWGAFSLILRHPDLFQKAVVWDAPLMMDQPGLYGSGPIFGTADNFQSYQVSRLLRKADPSFRQTNRLTLLGYGNFRKEQIQAHDLMNSLKIQHTYRDGPYRVHDWHSGWVEDALTHLFP